MTTSRRTRKTGLGAAGKSPTESGGELALVARIRERVGTASVFKAGSRVRLGIGDDCALLRLGAGEDFAVTTDLSIEGRHFRLDWHPPESIGHRTLARGLSDLAAMGARPVAAFLSLSMPAKLARAAKRESAWVERFLDGLLALAAEAGVPLAGGDLAESPMVVADIVLTGAVPKGEALLRSGARVGDGIFVTGSLGGAAAELAALGAAPRKYRLKTAARKVRGHSLYDHPHLYPQPRLAQGLWLRARATAAMDLSDGLSTDLARLCEASNVAAEVDRQALPLGRDATFAMALDGGEDYELLFTAPIDGPGRVRIPRSIAGVRVTKIGRVVAYDAGRPRVVLRSEDGSEPLKARGWEHFSG